MKTYTETDALGEHKVIEQKNGIKIRLLKNPSEDYKAKLEARAIKEKKRMDAEKVERDKEAIIQNKMRELAIAELEREGKL
jgi:hypothetical protein